MDVIRRMTKEEREYYTDLLNKAEPYEPDNPHYGAWHDPETDPDRMDATIAKKFLAEDDALRREQEARLKTEKDKKL